MGLRVCEVVWGLRRGCWGDWWGGWGSIHGRGGLLGQSRRDRPLRVVVAWDESSGNLMWMGRIENCFGMTNADC